MTYQPADHEVAASDSIDRLPVLSPGRVVLASLAVVGVDLFFNAGVLTPLFDRAREPALLDDETLFRRVPVAYAALTLVVAGLAWVLDRTRRRGRQAIATGAVGGLILGVGGLGALWTAVDLSGWFVIAGIGVLTAQGGAAAAVLTADLPNRRLALRVIGVVVTFFVLGQIIANSPS